MGQYLVTTLSNDDKAAFFPLMSKLTYLTLQSFDLHSDMSALAAGTLQTIANMSNLRRLRLLHVRLPNFREVSWDNSELTNVVFFGCNNIENLHSLCTVSTLTDLNLRNNYVEHDSDGLFKNLAKMHWLRTLDVSTKDPRYYDAPEYWLLTRCTNLQTLKLRTERKDIADKMRKVMPDTHIVTSRQPLDDDSNDDDDTLDKTNIDSLT